MASNNYLLLLPLVVLVVASVVSADADLSGLLNTLSSQGNVASLQEGMQCVKKLVPCKSYLNNNVSGVPPETCCSSLKEMVSDDFECLCRFYNEPQILQSLNITKHDARQLPKACNVRLRLSKCKSEASPPAQTLIPGIPTDPAERQEAAEAVLAAVTSSSQNVPSATTTTSSASIKAISSLAVVAVASAPFLFIH